LSSTMENVSELEQSEQLAIKFLGIHQLTTRFPAGTKFRKNIMKTVDAMLSETTVSIAQDEYALSAKKDYFSAKTKSHANTSKKTPVNTLVLNVLTAAEKSASNAKMGLSSEATVKDVTKKTDADDLVLIVLIAQPDDALNVEEISISQTVENASQSRTIVMVSQNGTEQSLSETKLLGLITTETSFSIRV